MSDGPEPVTTLGTSPEQDRWFLMRHCGPAGSCSIVPMEVNESNMTAVLQHSSYDSNLRCVLIWVVHVCRGRNTREIETHLVSSSDLLVYSNMFVVSLHPVTDTEIH